MTTTWSPNGIDDLSGQVVVVTGANSGIGWETAAVSADHGATVVLACRDEDRAGEAAARITRSHPAATIVPMTLDLASLDSVGVFASEFTARFDRLDRLVNNAGIMSVPYGLTVDGFERQIGTNHLGHFVLTGSLLDRLTATPASRVVTVSSIAHREADLDLNDLLYGDGLGYEPMKAYRRSKLCNLLFAYELDRRLRSAGHDVASMAAHPGVSPTNLLDHLGWWAKLVKPAARLLFHGAADGALPILQAAFDDAAAGGEYYGPTGRGEMKGPPGIVTSAPLSQDPDTGASLWQLSERLTGVSFLS